MKNIKNKVLSHSFSFTATLSLCLLPLTAQAGDSDSPESLRAQLDALPAGSLTPLPEYAGLLGMDSEWREARDAAIQQAIDPSQYECSPTDFNVWINGQLGQLQNFPAFVDIANLGALDWATYYVMLMDQDASDESFGIDGSLGQELKKRHRDAQRFWDIESDDILLQGMHGSYVADDAKMVPLVEILYGVDTTTAQLIVDYAQSVIESDPGFGYAFPFLTLNAFAVTTVNEPEGSPFFGIPDKIIMGDGLMTALDDMGIGAHAPDAVHAHEFAHHVQYELGLLDGVAYTPENTRWIELMADALGAYFSAHARGSSFQAKRIAETYRSSYLIGDCYFDSPSHHGTPNQREAAARWGADTARELPRGHVNSSMEMSDRFMDMLPIFLAPDAE